MGRAAAPSPPHQIPVTLSCRYIRMIEMVALHICAAAGARGAVGAITDQVFILRPGLRACQFQTDKMVRYQTFSHTLRCFSGLQSTTSKRYGSQKLGSFFAELFYQEGCSRCWVSTNDLFYFIYSFSTRSNSFRKLNSFKIPEFRTSNFPK